MKFSEQWLRSWANPALTTQQMCDQLTMAGLEVDSVELAAGDFSNVFVARVESMQKHPDADKLNVCQVSDGKESLQIVCGAANVREGLLIPLAKIGAVLPGADGKPWQIKPAKLRGVESSGMLCSEKELGLADSADGLMALPADAPVGQNIRDYLQLDDNIIELDLTPNRGDCLSIAGIARELGVLNQCEVTAQQTAPCTHTISDEFAVEIQAEDACPHYVGRVIKGIDVTAETPLWMLERLRRSGIRGLSPVVDITNYVMLEFGQPMHAFDLHKLDGKISVRYSFDKENITLLDGKTIELQQDTLVIADDAKLLALAGVMGAENSAVDDTTKDVFLESAFFKPEIIAGKARSYGLHTDSSHRFERGVDVQLQLPAIERATQLISEICGGEIGPVIEHKTTAYVDKKTAINLRFDQIKRVLGIEMPAEDVEEILQRLGMEIQSASDGWLVTPPGFRFDVEIEADLLEELVRVYGYNNIPRTSPSYHSVIQPQPEAKNSLSNIKNSLVNRGYYEAICYSFVDPTWQKIIDPETATIALANPLSSEMSVMRTTMWPGLLNALKHNINRQQSRVRLFETGLCFVPGEGAANRIAGHNDTTGISADLDHIASGVNAIRQEPMFSGVICGELHHEQWAEKSRKVDFFDIKSDVEALLSYSAKSTEFEAAEHPALHPGQSASIKQAGEVVGWIGALHPQVQKALDIDPQVFVFELKQSAIENNNVPAFSALSRYPEVRRDLALLLDEQVPVGEIISKIKQSSSALVKDIQLFDIYQGKGVEKGRKSVAFGLIFQGFSRTLTDREVDAEVDNIVSTLNQQFAATLRE